MTDDPAHDAIAEATHRLRLAAGTYTPGHTYAQAYQDLAEAIKKDWDSPDPVSQDEARRTALALLGIYAPPPLDPLPDPGTPVYGETAERLPVGSVVYREDIDRSFGKRVHTPKGWKPDLARDIVYRVEHIPAQRVSS